jgi:hypothetical protein
MSDNPEKLFDPKYWIITFAIGLIPLAGVAYMVHRGMKPIDASEPRVATAAPPAASATPTRTTERRTSSERVEAPVGEPIETASAAGGLPLDFIGMEIGAKQTHSFTVVKGEGDAEDARLHIGAFDIDDASEVKMTLNGHELALPTGVIFDNRERNDWIPIDPLIVNDGENIIEFELAATESDGEADGFRIDEVRIELMSATGGWTSFASQGETTPGRRGRRGRGGLGADFGGFATGGAGGRSEIRMRGDGSGSVEIHEFTLPDGGRGRAIIRGDAIPVIPSTGPTRQVNPRRATDDPPGAIPPPEG